MVVSVLGPGVPEPPANLDGVQRTQPSPPHPGPGCQGQGSIPTGMCHGQDTQVLVPTMLSTGCGLLGIGPLLSRPQVPPLQEGWFMIEEPASPCV